MPGAEQCYNEALLINGKYEVGIGRKSENVKESLSLSCLTVFILWRQDISPSDFTSSRDQSYMEKSTSANDNRSING